MVVIVVSSLGLVVSELASELMEDNKVDSANDGMNGIEVNHGDDDDDNSPMSLETIVVDR